MRPGSAISKKVTFTRVTLSTISKLVNAKENAKRRRKLSAS